MKSYDSIDVAVIGAGLGGLSAAIRLAAQGVNVAVFESHTHAGGKAQQVYLDGVWADTGPSVLTMPEVLDDLLHIGGTSLAKAVPLRTPSPSFEYRYADGCVIHIYPSLEETLAEISQVLGDKHSQELSIFLQYAKEIWDASSPHFIYGASPTWLSMLMLAFRHISLIKKVDPLRSMNTAIYQYISSPHIRMLLQRYATYNGSDPRVAPATLNCIAHVELALGGFGVEGGIYQIIQVLLDCAQRLGVRFHFATPIQKIILTKHNTIQGILLQDGTNIPVQRVVSNADCSFLHSSLIPSPQNKAIQIPEPFSMSGWTGIFRGYHKSGINRTAHTILFPKDYNSEFADIFDRNIPPQNPTIYLCAQSTCHGREGWNDAEAVFTMINTPPEPPNEFSNPEIWKQVVENIDKILCSANLKTKQDVFLWERSPSDLARLYPGSRGAIYGASSNNRFAAFTRPANTISRIPGLFIASGSAHPGGGMPLALLSGKAAAEGLIKGLSL